MKTLKRLSALVRKLAGSLVLMACAVATPTAFSSSGSGYAFAQTVSTDGTLSTNVSTSASGKDFTITAGSISGTNLFHSFEEFSVPTGGSATFSNATDVLNIISRVTGGDPSNIDGAIKANGSANLFLLNPSGIVFSPGAALDIGGSFTGTTAQSLQFADGATFTATQPTANPLLTISAPSGLQFGQGSGSIRVDGAGYSASRLPNLAVNIASPSTLQVRPGRSLSLIGNGLSLENARLATQAGQVELSSVANGQVLLLPDGTFDYQNVAEFNNIQLSQSIVDAVSPGGGLINLRGNDITLQNESRVFVQNLSTRPSGGISLQATGDFEIRESQPTRSTGSAIITESLLGVGGDINVSAERMMFTGGSGIQAKAFFAPGGSIFVNATESILLSPPASEIRDLSATDEISTSGIDALAFASGQGGNITVKTPQLTLQNGGRVAALTQGTGDSGDVTINARAITVEGVRTSDLSTSLISAGTFSSGDAGNLFIDTEKLVVRNGGRVDSSTLASGNSGSVVINASQSVAVSGQVPGSVNPSLIIASANLLDDSLRIPLGLPPLPSGDSGDLTINTPLLKVYDGGQVTVRNDGEGSGGTLRVNARNIGISNAAGITASTRSGGGGNIDLQATGPILLRRGGVVSADASGAGNGGNIVLRTPFLLALENSDIIANAFEGNGGNIQISARNILGTTFREQQTAESDITASSQLGVSGVVDITSLDIDPASGTEALPENVADASEQVIASCDRNQGNEFVASGRGGLPLNPSQRIMGGRLWDDFRSTTAGTVLTDENSTAAESFASEQHSLQASSLLMEATAWASNAQGETRLIAAANLSEPAVPAVNCLHEE